MIFYTQFAILFYTFQQVGAFIRQSHTYGQECHYDECEQNCFHPSKIVINNYKNIKSDELQKPFSSVCVNCLICLTIAQQIHNSLAKSHYMQCNQMLNEDKINTTLESICETGFKNYDLREYSEGFRCLSLPTVGSKHIPSNMDGMWIKKLKETCYTFINVYGKQNLYMMWYETFKKFYFILDVHLCKSYGLFGQCRNIDVDVLYNTNFSLISILEK